MSIFNIGAGGISNSLAENVIESKCEWIRKREREGGRINARESV